MAKWEIIEDIKFKKQTGGKAAASRAVPAKRTAVKAAATPNNLTIITPEQKEKTQADYDEAYKWTSDYMKSPMYKKMLTESSANTREFNNIDNTRWSNFQSIPPLQILPQPRNEPKIGGTSLGFNGQIQLFPHSFGTKGTYSHELSHSTDRPVEESDSRIIPQSDKNYISQHVPTTFEDSPMYATNKSFYDLFKKNKPKEYKKEANDYKKFHINYVGQDTETRARLNAIRQGAQQNNLYDPFKEGVTPELYYDKLKNFKFEKEDKSGADPMYQLKNVYSDEEIIYMLNHISENKKEDDGTELNNLPKAKNGLAVGERKILQRPTQPVQEKSVFKPIPTTVKPQYKSEGDYLNQVYGEDSGVQLPGQSSTLRVDQDAEPAYDVAKQDYASYKKDFSNQIEEEQEQKIDEQVAKFLKANPLPESKSDKADYIENLSPYDRQLIQSSSYSNEFLPAFRQYQNRVGENAKKYSLKETFSDPNKLSEVAQLGLNRFRFFPNATNSIEDFVNPGIWLGQMEQGVADIPKNIRDENYLGAAMGVVNPILMGRIMGSGSINPLGKKFWTNEVSTPQFINNLVNPLAGIVENPLVNYAENNRFLPNINEIKQFSEIFKKPALPEFISNTEQELLHTNRNIGKQIKEGILDIQDDVSAKEAIKFLNNVKDKSSLLTDDQFLRLTGFEKNQIDNKIQEVLKKQEALKNIQSQKKNYTVLGEDEETIDLSRRFNLQRNSRSNLRSYNLNNTLNNTLGNVNLNSNLTTPTEKPFVFKNFLEKLKPKPQIIDRDIIDHDLVKSLSAGKGVSPARVIMKAVNEVKALDKGVTVNAAHSLSSDSKFIELRMLEKLLEEDIVSVNYHGMAPLNNMGFSQKTRIPSTLNLKEINTNIHNVNQLLPKNKKIPFATINENGQIWYPDISATRKKYGGVIEDPMGQWAHPGSVTRIPSNQITMQGVNYPVLGISDRGHTQMMYPGKDYSFRGKSVTEYPMMQGGGRYISESVQPQPSKNYTGTFLPINRDPYGNARKKLFDNENRSPSTESVIGINDESSYYNIPTVINGVRLSDDDAVNNFYDNGMYHTGYFNTQEEADRSADYRERANIGLSSTGLYKYGGEVNFTYAGENHRVYEKVSPTGNGKGIEGHIMVNHPTKNKGKWDTIDLTKITNGKVKTVAQGVASTKKWHKENPEYADGGMIKRADGSYSKRGLWDNIRDNAGSGKKPTPEMLEQERKIKSQYANGGQTNIPIYVTNPNDPRLKLYSDSLGVYNGGKQLESLANLAVKGVVSDYNKNKHFWESSARFSFHKQPPSSIDEGFYYDTESRNDYSAPTIKNINNYINSGLYNYFNGAPSMKPISVNIYSTNLDPLDKTGGSFTAIIPEYKKPVQPYILQIKPPILPPVPGPKPPVTTPGHSSGTTSYLNRTLITIPNPPITRPLQEEISMPTMGNINSDQQISQPINNIQPIISLPKDYVTITDPNMYRNPDTNAFQHKTYRIDKVTGKRITEPSFKNGGQISNWEIIEDLPKAQIGTTTYPLSVPTRTDSLNLYNNAVEIGNYFDKHPEYQVVDTKKEEEEQLKSIKRALKAKNDYYQFLLSSAIASPDDIKEAKDSLKKFKATYDSFINPPTSITEANKKAVDRFNTNSKSNTPDNRPILIRNGVETQDSILPLNEYRNDINDNQYYQREQQNGRLNLDIPMQLFDKRINPDFKKTYLNELNHDGVLFYGYNPIFIKPYDLLTPGERIIVDEKNSTNTTTAPTTRQIQEEIILPVRKNEIDNPQISKISQPISNIPTVSPPKKDYVTIKTGSSYRNPETGAFEQKSFKIDKTTGKTISEPEFKSNNIKIVPGGYKNGGKTKKSSWQIIEY